MSLSRRALGASVLAFAFLQSAGRALAEAFNVQFHGPRKGWFKGRTRVSVASYQVNFVTIQQATAVGGFGARTRLTAVLSGVDEAVMKRLTDEAHADLKAQLEAAGIPVASDADSQGALASAGVELVPGNRVEGEPAGITIGQSVKQGWVGFGASAAPALKGFQILGKPMGLAMPGLMGVLNKLGKPSVAIDAAFVMPVLTIDFAQMEAKGGNSITSQFARAGGKPNFGVIGTGSPTQVFAANNDRGMGTGGSFWMKADVRSKTPFVASVGQGEAASRAMAAGDSRGDAVVVDLPVWEGLVRDAFRSYNASVVKAVQTCRG